MRMLLAGPDYEENLSIRYLSSSLQAAGHETVLATFNSEADLEAVAEAAEDADIVGLSMCFQSRALEFLHLAREIKSRDPQKPIVAGGHYASCAATELLEHHPEIDIIVIHEGERTLVEIADAGVDLEDVLPNIAGIAYRQLDQVCFTAARRTLDDLDSLPFPDRCGPVHYIAGVPTSYLMGSRGCYGSCAYCCITTLHRMAPGKRFRQRRPELIADEMAALYHHRGTRQFVFHDDNFLVPSESLNRARITAFEKALKERGVEDIALVIKCRPADTKLDVFRRLKQLGLVRVFLGIESATPQGLLSLERKQTVDESVRALEVCAELDISAQFTIMTFNPDATEETLRSDIMFMRQFRGNPLNFCRAEIYTGTPLEKRMIDVGRARGDYLARVYSMADPVTERACNIALNLFGTRCWSSNSLMQIAIGLDHTAAVAKRFYSGPERIAACDDVASWLRTVNLDTINLLEQVVDISASGASDDDPGLLRAVRDLKEHEAATRPLFLSEAMDLRLRLQALRQTGNSQFQQLPGPRLLLAKQVAAAVLAVGTPVASGSFQALAQEAKTQSSAGAAQKKTACSLAGTVTDEAGSRMANAKITVTNLGTKQVREVETDTHGHYAVNDLVAGRYRLKVLASGFAVAVRSAVALKAGEQKRIDFRLNRESWGCCEYAATPLPKPVPPERATPTPFPPPAPPAPAPETKTGTSALETLQALANKNTMCEETSKSPNQTQVASLSGVVKDRTGVPVSSALVTVTNAETNASCMVKADKAGKYSAVGLAAGRYSVSVDALNFNTAVQPDVALKADAHETVNFVLDMTERQGCCEYAPPPLKPIEIQREKVTTGSLIGTVTDQTGAAIPNANVTIMNLDTYEVLKLTTNETGGYASTPLVPGNYTLKVESRGFKDFERTKIILKPGAQERLDVTMQVGGDFGVCEYAAAPLDWYPEPVSPLFQWETPLWYRKKPFDYKVGSREKDRHSIYGVAALVYGDWRHWIPIFEANRDVLKKPGAIPDGTKLLIPPEKHNIPKLASKVMPVYPAEAAKENIVGDVVLDLAINNDGTIAKVDVIDGDPLLVDAATAAVKKWRFQPPTGNQKALFVIAISFSKDGKIRIQM